jgi:two-component system, chemotaxis family, protein-glutamate methylesterase/glutaminase
MTPIRLLIVDDSAIARGVITEILRHHRDIQIVGYCHDGAGVSEAIERLNPDVVTLDVEMPRVAGLEVLKRLGGAMKTPIIMVSGVTTQGAQVALECLNLGAVDFVVKPSPSANVSHEDAVKNYRKELVEKILAAALSRPLNRTTSSSHLPSTLSGSTASINQRLVAFDERLIAIGASTGGPNAVTKILRELNPQCPPLVIAIHMPMPFTLLYAERINKLCQIKVVQASEGDYLEPGTAYIAPGDKHLVIRRVQLLDGQGSKTSPYRCSLIPHSEVDLYKPSIDRLFNSVALTAGKGATACVLTGMGRDGTAGSKAIGAAGGYVMSQDEASCVIFGMPKAAKQDGHVDKELTLEEFAPALNQLSRLQEQQIST